MKSFLLRVFIFTYNLLTVPVLVGLTTINDIWFTRRWTKAILPSPPSDADKKRASS